MDLRDQLQISLGSSYTLEHELMGGGMSRVFRATDRALGRQVVVKVVPANIGATVDIERFNREIQVAAGLQHAHIVPVLSAGQMDGIPYYTMPFVEGESLRERVTRVGALPMVDVISILRDVSKALAYAHERGIVHRDIKPDNVMLAGGSAMVTDFGIAKALSVSRTGDQLPTLTQVGTSLGTPAYMAPEQAAADPAMDHRADLYSFGCMAYEMLSGRPPFVTTTPQRLLAAQMSEIPSAIIGHRQDAPPALADMVMRCLEKEPDRRPASAQEIARLLESVTSGPTNSTRSPLLDASGMIRRIRAVHPGAALVQGVRQLSKTLRAALTVLAITGTGISTWMYQRQQVERAFLAERAHIEATKDTLLRQLNLIKAFDQDRYVWPHILDELEIALPQSTWLTSLVLVGTPQGSVNYVALPAKPPTEPQRLETLIPPDSIGVRLQGLTLDVQAFTRFYRSLEDSPFLGNVKLWKTEVVLVDGKEVTQFALDMLYSRPHPSLVRRAPWPPRREGGESSTILPKEKTSVGERNDLDSLREEVDQYRAELLLARRLIPTVQEVPDLLDAIATLGRRTDIEIMGVAPKRVVQGDQINTHVYAVSAKGTYHNVAAFLTGIGSLERMFVPSNLQLARHQNGRERRNEVFVRADFDIQMYVANKTGAPQSAARAQTQSPSVSLLRELFIYQLTSRRDPFVPSFPVTTK